MEHFFFYREAIKKESHLKLPDKLWGGGFQISIILNIIRECNIMPLCAKPWAKDFRTG